MKSETTPTGTTGGRTRQVHSQRARAPTSIHVNCTCLDMLTHHMPVLAGTSSACAGWHIICLCLLAQVMAVFINKI